MSPLVIALEEEIGNPELFVGREDELNRLLNWAEKSKNKLAKSRAILARRKKGKTALLQRFFNILYTRNDARIVPFFFRVKEDEYNLPEFASLFYRAFITQFLGFRLREPKLVNQVLTYRKLRELAADDRELHDDIVGFEEILEHEPALAWDQARDAPHRLATLKDIRIIQIIDEFQYMNRYLYKSAEQPKQVNVCHSYMGAAESKVAPLVVTGSYIGWLSAILTYMTSRFEDEALHALTPSEAVATVYNYARITGVPIREKTAPYIAAVAHNDAFYISQMIRTRQPGHDLTTESGVRAALQFETSQGFIAKVWMEYIQKAFSEVNEINAKRMVLYLAKYGDEERTRKQIKDDLHLDLADTDLERRLEMLRMADLIAPGASHYHYQGLGDPIFEMVFRKYYGPEIEALEPAEIDAEIDISLSRLKPLSEALGERLKEHHIMYSDNHRLTAYEVNQ